MADSLPAAPSLSRSRRGLPSWDRA